MQKSVLMTDIEPVHPLANPMMTREQAESDPNCGSVVNILDRLERNWISRLQFIESYLEPQTVRKWSEDLEFDENERVPWGLKAKGDFFYYPSYLKEKRLVVFTHFPGETRSYGIEVLRQSMMLSDVEPFDEERNPFITLEEAKNDPKGSSAVEAMLHLRREKLSRLQYIEYVTRNEQPSEWNEQALLQQMPRKLANSQQQVPGYILKRKPEETNFWPHGKPEDATLEPQGNSVLMTDIEPIHPLSNPVVTLEEARKDIDGYESVVVMGLLKRDRLTRLQYIEFLIRNGFSETWSYTREDNSAVLTKLKAVKNYYYYPSYLKGIGSSRSNFFPGDTRSYGIEVLRQSMMLSDVEPFDEEKNPFITLEEAKSDPKGSSAVEAMLHLRRDKISRLQYIEYATRNEQPNEWNEEGLLQSMPEKLAKASKQVPGYILKRKPEEVNFWPHGKPEDATLEPQGNSILMTDIEPIHPLSNPLIMLSEIKIPEWSRETIHYMKTLNRDSLTRLQFIECLFVARGNKKWSKEFEMDFDNRFWLRADRDYYYLPSYLNDLDVSRPNFFPGDTRSYGIEVLRQSMMLSDVEPFDEEKNPFITLEEAKSDPKGSSAVEAMLHLRRDKISRLQYIEYATRNEQPNEWNEEGLLQSMPEKLAKASKQVPGYILKRKPEEVNFWPHGKPEDATLEPQGNSILMTDIEPIHPLANPVVTLEEARKHARISTVYFMEVLKRDRLTRLQYIEFFITTHLRKNWSSEMEFPYGMDPYLRSEPNHYYLPSYLNDLDMSRPNFFPGETRSYGIEVLRQSMMLSDVEPFDEERNPFITLEEAKNDPKGSSAVEAMLHLRREKLSRLQYIEYVTRNEQPSEWNEQALLQQMPRKLANSQQQVPGYILKRKPEETNFWPHGKPEDE
jgi:hypothetical protein